MSKISKKYACNVCSLNCKTDCIFCETCKTWVHYSCESVKKADQKEWSRITLAYICVRCRCQDDGSFDFLMGSERLRQSAKQGLKKLKVAVEREVMYLRNVNLHTTLHGEFSKHEQDSVSNYILARYHTSSKAALKSTGDGDCLFNAVSTCLVGSEHLSIELRYRCCIEMVVNGEKIKRNKLYPRLELISPDFDKDCVDCAKQGSYSSVWRMIALSNLLNLPIDCVYPSINGYKHIAFQALNTTFRPPFVDPDNGRITIMWTSISQPDSNYFSTSKKSKREWFPNHFVPLVDVTRKRPHEHSDSATPQKAANSITVDDTTKTVFASPNRYEQFTDSEQPFCENNEDNVNCDMQETADIESPSSHKVLQTPEKIPQNLSTIVEESDDENSCYITETLSPLKDIVTDNEDSDSNDTFSTNVLNDSQNERHARSPIGSIPDYNKEEEEEELEFQPGPLGNKFMDVTETIRTLKGPYVMLDEIPTGRKDCCYYVLNNTNNIQKRLEGNRSNFWDDCGAWKNAASPSTYYVELNGNLVSIIKRNGVFCTAKQVNKKREFIPLEPQPEPSSVVEIYRLYQTLKASPAGKEQFKRRVSWLEKCPTNMHLPTNVAIAEYIGTFPLRQYHGRVVNADNNTLFIRSKQSVRDTLKAKLKERPLKVVERQMNIEFRNETEKQRNEKMLKNLKYSINKENRQPLESSNNVADNIISVEEMTKTHDFVKYVSHISGLQHPVIILYTEQQIKDIKRFCCKEGGSVLGIDKTYNLGDFHVTPTVYKDQSVIKRNSEVKTHPICFGPTLIHTSSTTSTYSFFMHQIADRLTENELSLLTIGSDEELSFKNAIRRCFLGCTHVLCTRHLKQNTNRYMEDQVGFHINDRQDIMNDIFGVNGVVNAKDTDSFNHKVNCLGQKIEEKDRRVKKGDKTFQQYWEGKLLPLLKLHVIEPARQGKISTSWTNNNCESANHVLKRATQWKLKNLPDFIRTLYDIVLGEKIERCRAIRGAGNYKLDNNFVHHYLDIDRWSAISQEQRDKREVKFLNDKGKFNQNTVVSTNGARTVLKTPSAGKKPNQLKRKRAERTHTPSAKRKLID